MSSSDQQKIHLGRRDFIKTMTLAGVAAALPGGSALAEGRSAETVRSRPAGGKKTCSA